MGGVGIKMAMFGLMLLKYSPFLDFKLLKLLVCYGYWDAYLAYFYSTLIFVLKQSYYDFFIKIAIVLIHNENVSTFLSLLLSAFCSHHCMIDA